LVKKGGQLVKDVRYYWLMLAAGDRTRGRFAAMLWRIAMPPLPASERLAVESVDGLLKNRENGEVQEKSAGNAHRDAAETKRAPNHSDFQPQKGVLVLQDRVPAVQFGRIRDEKRDSSSDLREADLKKEIPISRLARKYICQYK
jgi:hypothetical protein